MLPVFLRVTIAFITILAAYPLPARHEADNWLFGFRAAISFEDGDPQIRSNGHFTSLEGCAAISDRHTGQLLFSSEGSTVWNAAHKVLRNGDGLKGSPTSTQSALFLPHPGNCERYFLFSVGNLSYPDCCHPGLWYSLIDASLDLGQGLVLQKNIKLADSTAEKVTATIDAEGSGFWLVTHHMHRNEFLAFHVGPEGIDPEPVVSRSGGISTMPGSDGFSVGYLKFTPQGDRLIMPLQRSGLGSAAQGLQLFGFDRTSGRVSDPVEVNLQYFPYSFAVSPDGSKLYYARLYRRVPASGGNDETYQSNIYQLDIAQADGAAILATHTLIDSVFKNVSFGSSTVRTIPLQLGPDGMIYLGIDRWLDRIEDPNAAGTACRYRHQAVALGDGRVLYGLPNFVEALYNHPGIPADCRPLADFEADTVLCAGDCLQLRNTSTAAGRQWQWYFEKGVPDSWLGFTPPPVCYPEAGTYEITLITYAVGRSDTARRLLRVSARPSLGVSEEQRICPGETALLKVSGAESYRWEPAEGLDDPTSDQPRARPSRSTLYRVRGSNGGCSASDSVWVYVNRPDLRISGDTTVCAGTALRLQVGGARSYHWQPEELFDDPRSPRPLMYPQESATVFLDWEDEFCRGRDSLALTVTPAPTITIMADTTICAEEAVRLWAGGGLHYRWEPADLLDDPNRPDPLARLSAATLFQVAVLNEEGCAARAEVRVDVRPDTGLAFSLTAPARSVLPGEEVFVDLTIEALDAALLPAAAIDDLRLQIAYDPAEIAFRPTAAVSGLAAADWRWKNDDDSREGKLMLRGSGPALTDDGLLLRIPCTPLLHKITSLALPLDLVAVELEDFAACDDLRLAGDSIRLAEVCLNNERLLNLFGFAYSLSEAFPNPADGSSELHYGIGLPGHVTMTIYTMLGEQAARLVDRRLQPGRYRVTLANLPAGVYHCVLRAGPFTASRQVVFSP